MSRPGRLDLNLGVFPGASQRRYHGFGRDGALRRPRRRAQRQAAERLNKRARFANSIAPPDAPLGGADIAARCPYLSGKNSVELCPFFCAWILVLGVYLHFPYIETIV